MKQIKTKHPAPFDGHKDQTLVLIYGEDNGVRYNVALVDAPEGTEGCASVLAEWNEETDYTELYRVTEFPTINPQKI